MRQKPPRNVASESISTSASSCRSRVADRSARASRLHPPRNVLPDAGRGPRAGGEVTPFGRRGKEYCLTATRRRGCPAVAQTRSGEVRSKVLSGRFASPFYAANLGTRAKRRGQDRDNFYDLIITPALRRTSEAFDLDHRRFWPHIPSEAFNNSRMFRHGVSLRSLEYPSKFIRRLRRQCEVLFTFYGSGAYGATA